MKYDPTLDGLRAIACLLVILHHWAVPFALGGFLGVDVFFVLSGYLITRVLAEHQPTLEQFYLRRLIRLMPPLVLMLIGTALVLEHTPEALVALLYFSDYWRAVMGALGPFDHTWSLAIEEHFYLLWPVVFYQSRPSVKALAVAFVLATLWRGSQLYFDSYYFRFDTHATGLILGCLIAQLPRDRFPAWPGLLALAVLTYALVQRSVFTKWVGFGLIELSAAVVILGRRPQWMGKLAYLGKLSYGVYLWHFPITYYLQYHVPLTWWQGVPITVAGSVALAALSYHTVEAWFRNRRVSSSARQLTGPAPDSPRAPSPS